MAGPILFEDDHLLVVYKPSGWNTHAPAPFAGEGLYDWLRHREPRWANLAIMHRLDKETSGVMVFAKTSLANRSLTEQFAARTIRKKYVFLTDRPVPWEKQTVRSVIQKMGDRHVSRPASSADGEAAETDFIRKQTEEGRTVVEAFPRTGRTHQIRLHAAGLNLPILGDVLYGGTPFARLCLHAAELAFSHPESGAPLKFEVAPDFGGSGAEALRRACLDLAQTDAFRLSHGAADGEPGWYVDKLGEYLLAQAGSELTDLRKKNLETLSARWQSRGCYYKPLLRSVRGTTVADTSPRLVTGEAAPEEFGICENGLHYGLRFQEGYSVGLFLDQRDNRRRFFTGHVAAGFPPLAGKGTEVLNTFAYTCGFSVAAAAGGARVTSLDLSKKYLDWGRQNFLRNGLDPSAHDFIFGDVFDWLRRLGKKGRLYDAVVLDPPTFSQSKESGVFRVEKDYGKLTVSALKVLRPDGVLLASTNAAELPPEKFRETLHTAIRAEGRRVSHEHFVPQPPDFPVTRMEPGYLKTFWLRISP